MAGASGETSLPSGARNAGICNCSVARSVALLMHFLVSWVPTQYHPSANENVQLHVMPVGMPLDVGLSTINARLVKGRNLPL